MKKTVICNQCKKEVFVNQKINGKWHKISKNRLCFDCKPLYSDIKNHITKMHRTDGHGINKLCPKCLKILSLDNFSNNNKDGYKTTLCKKCSLYKSRNSRRRFKQDCIDFLGGRCSICSYNKCPDALEFHHIVPGKKDFSISKFPGTIITDKVIEELSKCRLLCSNCHRELHYSITEERYAKDMDLVLNHII